MGFILHFEEIADIRRDPLIIYFFLIVIIRLLDDLCFWNKTYHEVNRRQKHGYFVQVISCVEYSKNNKEGASKMQK